MNYDLPLIELIPWKENPKSKLSSGELASTESTLSKEDEKKIIEHTNKYFDILPIKYDDITFKEDKIIFQNVFDYNTKENKYFLSKDKYNGVFIYSSSPENIYGKYILNKRQYNNYMDYLEKERRTLISQYQVSFSKTDNIIDDLKSFKHEYEEY